LRHFFTRAVPPFERVLLVESGGRHLFEALIPGIYETYGGQTDIDLVTCYAGTPAGFQGNVYRVTDYTGPQGRQRLYGELKARRHTVAGVICSNEPIMTKWKWMLAARTPAKVFVLNENGDYFWLQWSEWRTIRHFVVYRAGLSGAGAVGTIARLLLFPFTLLYLICYAAAVHLRRKVRI
jgi:hypothetical protein